MLFTVIAAALGLSAPLAHAGKRNVVLLPVKARSKRAKVCKRSVLSVMRSAHTLMPTRKYMRTRAVMKRRAWSQRNIKAVARAIGADAVVHMRFAWRRRKLNLIVRVREGKTGRIVDTLRFRLRRGRCDMRTLKQLRDRLLTTLGEAEPIDDVKQEPTQSEPGTEPAPDPEPTPGTDDEPTVRKRAPQSGDSVLGVLGGHLNVGFSAIGRQLEFTVADGIPSNMHPRPYDGGLVGGLHVDGELYPFKHKTKKSLVSGIGLSFGLDHSVGMKSTLSENGTDQQFATTQSRWAVGVRYRIPLGRSGLKLAAGYDTLSLIVDSGGVMTGVPNTSYGYADLGADLELALGSLLTLGVGGRYLHVLDAGDLTTPAAYGRTAVTGASGRASLGIHLGKSLTVSAGVTVVRMNLEFDGSGDMTDVNGDAQQDVSSASDTYAGGFVSAGYRF